MNLEATLIITADIVIPLREIDLTAIRAQGAGGQHVNKTASAIHLRFNILTSSLPTAYKDALLKQNHHLITKEGMIIIKSQEHRSQELNKFAAFARLQALLKAAGHLAKTRYPTHPSRQAKRRRTDQKVKHGQIKILRAKIDC